MKLKTLYAKYNGICYWCGVMTILPPDGTGVQFGNMATREHLLDKFTGAKYSERQKSIVLACFDCNNAWGQLRYLAQPIEVLISFYRQGMQRAGHTPSKIELLDYQLGVEAKQAELLPMWHEAARNGLTSEL